MSPSLTIECLELGLFQTNCYILADTNTKKACVVDPGSDAEIIWNRLSDNQWKLSSIILTHGHFDHIGATEDLKKKSNAPVLVHAEDAEMLRDPLLNVSAYVGGPVIRTSCDKNIREGDTIPVGDYLLHVIETPGHSPGSISLFINDTAIVGDTIFKDGIGRTDLPGGSMEQLLLSIKEKIMVRDSTVRLLPGHGPSTTIGREKEKNPYLDGYP